MPDNYVLPARSIGTDPSTDLVSVDNPISQADDEGDQGSANDASWDSSMRSDFTSCLTDASGSTKIAMPPPAFRKKRKGGSLSPTKHSDGQGSNKPSSDTREKRLRLTGFDPPGTFGIPDVANYEPDEVSRMPSDIVLLLASTFPIGDLEAGCFPITSEIEHTLQSSFPHEPIPRHARFNIDTSNSNDVHNAHDLVEFAIDIHRACLQNSCNAEDEAAWYPIVRRLLSISPPTASSVIARPPSHTLARTKHDLFITIDATTKSTCIDLSPAVTIKLDVLVAFNPLHPLLSPILDAGVRVNAFTDSSIRTAIVVLGVEVKSGASGALDAEYQVGVWGMKTLSLMRSLRKSTAAASGEYAIGISVCAHVWSFHVTYWRGDGIVTHGPVCIGSTDSLYGTMKIVAFVRRFKEWAGDRLLADWTALVGCGGGKGKGKGMEVGVGLDAGEELGD